MREALSDVLGWLDRYSDYFSLLDAAGAVTAGLVLGFLGEAAAGRRGRLYGAMMGGMILNLVSKLEGASYLPAFVMMVIVTLVAFLLGETRWLPRLARARRRG